MHDPRIKVIHLSRHFGHQVALTAGLDYAAGDAIVAIDADLQDPLSVVHQMIERYRESYDVAYGQREMREGEAPFKRWTAWAFYRLMRRTVYHRPPVDTGDFRLMSRACLDGLRSMREVHRFMRGMVAWGGFPEIAVPYCRAARAAGGRSIATDNARAGLDGGDECLHCSPAIQHRDRPSGGIAGQ
jgi:polyisoprenyl-phosphate glycosyltransferase